MLHSYETSQDEKTQLRSFFGMVNFYKGSYRVSQIRLIFERIYNKRLLPDVREVSNAQRKYKSKAVRDNSAALVLASQQLPHCVCFWSRTLFSAGTVIALAIELPCHCTRGTNFMTLPGGHTFRLIHRPLCVPVDDKPFSSV